MVVQGTLDSLRIKTQWRIQGRGPGGPPHPHVVRPNPSKVLSGTEFGCGLSTYLTWSTLISIRHTDVDRLMIRTQSKG